MQYVCIFMHSKCNKQCLDASSTGFHEQIAANLHENNDTPAQKIYLTEQQTINLVAVFSTRLKNIEALCS